MHTTTSRLYLGIDPSLRSSGFGIVGTDYCEVHVSQPKKLVGGDRLKYHVDKLREILSHHDIIAAAIEGPALNAVNRADDLGQIRGTFLYVLAELGIPVTVLPPTSVKKFATGSGSAGKEQMLHAAHHAWPTIQFLTDDAADAAWIAAFAQALTDDVPVTASQLSAIRGIRGSHHKPKGPRPSKTLNV